MKMIQWSIKTILLSIVVLFKVGVSKVVRMGMASDTEIGETTSSMFSLLILESSNNPGFFKNPKSKRRNNVFNVFTLASGSLKQFQLLQKSQKANGETTSLMFSLLPLESSRLLANVQVWSCFCITNTCQK